MRETLKWWADGPSAMRRRSPSPTRLDGARKLVPLHDRLREARQEVYEWRLGLFTAGVVGFCLGVLVMGLATQHDSLTRQQARLDAGAASSVVPSSARPRQVGTY